ncbi:MAG: InlB B-repeat-containing protein, partial [Planctomycetota bacterium]
MNILSSKMENQPALRTLALAFAMAIAVLASASKCQAVTLTITATNGSVTATPDKADYNVGEVVELKPRPDTGYYFSGWAGDARGKRLVLNLTMDSDKAITADFDTWQPPIGIPVPEFGILETVEMYVGRQYTFADGRGTIQYPISPVSAKPYTHYVDNTHSNATDSGNPYGTPSKPRNTIPLNLVAGSVVEVHNGTYTYTNYEGSLGITGSATATQPIIVRGPDIDNRPVFNSEFRIDGEYIILENINSDGSAGSGNGGGRVLAPAHHIAVRKVEIQNRTGGPTTALSSGSWTSEWSHDIVFYNNIVHDVGDWQTSGDEDHHAIGPGGRAYNIWIVDNEVWHASGDGTQVNAGNTAPSNLTHHIYVGRNLYHENKQSGAWVKNAQDVVISQNEFYNFQPSGSSSGQCTGYQHDPQRVWILFNYLHHAKKGLATGSPNIRTREDIYIIGNVIHDVETGIEINNHGLDSEMIVGNTIYNVDIGIANGYYAASVEMFDNLISGVNSHHIYFPSSYNTGDNSDMDFMLFDSPAKIGWGDGSVRDLSGFQSAYGKCPNGIEADPLLVDAAGGDFRLQLTSPAIDTGVSSGTVQQMFDTFQSLYGIDIRKDIEGISRPQGAEWDIGAYEHVGGSGNQIPVANAGQDQTITDSDGDGSELVTLDGSGSADWDGTIESYAWTQGGTQIAAGVQPTVTLSTGQSIIALTVTDNDGATDTDTVIVTTAGVNAYTLTVNTSGTGSVTRSPDKSVYDAGETVTLTAVAGSNYLFSNWSGDLSGTSNPTT